MGKIEAGMRAGGRIETIDFWRGLVLVLIFVNHVPGNLFEQLTPRNFGFSDSAEAFVFVSGLAVALAYYPRVVAGDWLGTARRCLRRASQIYAVHLFITLVALALFGHAFSTTGNEDLLAAHGRDLPFADPVGAVIGIIFLGHQIGYFNILPLYIVLMMAAPVILVAARANPLLPLAASLAIYALTRVLDLNLPNWPVPGGWFFDPLAWQLMFTLGLAGGVIWHGRALPYSRTLFLAALVVLWIGFIVVTNGLGQSPGLYDELRDTLDLSKTDLGLGRAIHFLALAYVLSELKVGQAMLALPGADRLTLLGRNGLAVFAAGSLLSAMGQIALTVSGDSPIIGVLFVLTGIIGLIAFARTLEWRTSLVSARKLPSSARFSGSRPALDGPETTP